MALALALVVTCLVVAMTQNQREAAIRDVPTAERKLIFQEGLSEMKSTCLQGYASKGPLRDLCVDKARLILLFPECDAACRTAATAVLPRAHR